MSVYLQDGMVLLDSDMVATDAMCCCNTGACCVDTDCSIQTESDCTDMGGTYQGDDTTCDPNPCGMVDCPCGFDAFDGSGRRFLVMTAVMSGFDHVFAPFPTCSLDYSATVVRTIDPLTCIESDVFSGSSTYTPTGDPPQTCTFISCGAPGTQWTCDDGGTGPHECNNSCGVPGSCFVCNTSATPVSATVATCTFTDSGVGFSCFQTLTLTLSNECNPI